MRHGNIKPPAFPHPRARLIHDWPEPHYLSALCTLTDPLASLVSKGGSKHFPLPSPLEFPRLETATCPKTTVATRTHSACHVCRLAHSGAAPQLQQRTPTRPATALIDPIGFRPVCKRNGPQQCQPGFFGGATVRRPFHERAEWLSGFWRRRRRVRGECAGVRPAPFLLRWVREGPQRPAEAQHPCAACCRASAATQRR